MKDERRLYGDLAWIWPIISSSDEYVQESEQFCELVRRHSHLQPKTLLNLGCGGGRNDFTLKKHFQVTGVDISEDMLETAKRVNPEVTYLVGDMRSLQLGKTF
ncbi:MAG: methyltransferase domain-containing protein, partial [Armatimonadetes bacterium]|nr:methyltransferase domain-containing protein [Armatimonadota bacterium]NIM22961.1 methyltransferase domain-containing protein [Armatimonadota bacterium]NIM66832.1 methyltransferase domain-containing protein [Armatimonadota bacterium]NIM75373.1 methyltransferase domain-containing protein [Armatimonadota bacterium]NIN05020.1 methyltransferase domain-containing protein [Armatimonadota bacterium]